MIITMSKNLKIGDIVYENIASIQLPTSNGTTARFCDNSLVDATASDVATGKIFVDSEGNVIPGTASFGEGNPSPKIVVKQTENQTITLTGLTAILDAIDSDAGIYEIKPDRVLVKVTASDEKTHKAGNVTVGGIDMGSSEYVAVIGDGIVVSATPATKKETINDKPFPSDPVVIAGLMNNQRQLIGADYTFKLQEAGHASAMFTLTTNNGDNIGDLSIAKVTIDNLTPIITPVLMDSAHPTMLLFTIEDTTVASYLMGRGEANNKYWGHPSYENPPAVNMSVTIEKVA